MCELTSDHCAGFSKSKLAPMHARSYVDRHACPEHGALAQDALMLITSELVTNAVLYGESPITVQLSCHVTDVRLTVADAGAGLPDEQGTSGHLGTGLRIVAGIAREWGVTPRDVGKEVWCVVPTGLIPEQRSRDFPSRATEEPAGLSEPARGRW